MFRKWLSTVPNGAPWTYTVRHVVALPAVSRRRACACPMQFWRCWAIVDITKVWTHRCGIAVWNVLQKCVPTAFILETIHRDSLMLPPPPLSSLPHPLPLLPSSSPSLFLPLPLPFPAGYWLVTCMCSGCSDCSTVPTELLCDDVITIDNNWGHTEALDLQAWCKLCFFFRILSNNSFA